MKNTVKYDLHTRQIICTGIWNLSTLPELESDLKKLTTPSSGEVAINAKDITQLDTAGAWLLSALIKKLSKKGIKVSIQNLSEEREKLLKLTEKQLSETTKIPHLKIPNWLARVGKSTIEGLDEANEYLSFIGKLAIEAIRITTHPIKIRWNDFVGVVEKAGYQALPIIAILSFMIGVVLAYQMGLQLKHYGANIFIVELIGYSILREFGPLITAIMVAGRTGSAFTAQLGIMRINQEIDALDTMGVTSAELLLLPRIIGLLIALPLLTIWADIFGVFGGMINAKATLGISWSDFLSRFEHQVPMRHLIIGLAKAPVFAFIIGSIGCFQGMMVGGSADSIGKQTTRSVVLSIFFIIVADSFFAITLSKFDL